MIMLTTLDTLLLLVSIQSLWPNDTKWCYRSWLPLVQVIACDQSVAKPYTNICISYISKLQIAEAKLMIKLFRSNLTINAINTAAADEAWTGHGEMEF